MQAVSHFTPDRAAAVLAAGKADAIAFGRAFIADLDLSQRIARGLPLANDDRSTGYGQGEAGYVDCPVADEVQAAA